MNDSGDNRSGGTAARKLFGGVPGMRRRKGGARGKEERRIVGK
jgi:hypothetical protein